MSEDLHEIVSAGLKENLNRLWRYGLVLSGNRDAAEDLVQATCVRALERSSQFQAGTHVDRWLFTILSSIWKNELRSQKIRQGSGFVDAEEALVSDGAKQVETNIFAAQVLREIQELPEVQRTTVFLVYGEGLTYQEAADTLDVPVGTIMSRLASARTKLGQLNDAASSARTEKGQRE